MTLLTIDMSILANKAFAKVRKTERDEDWEVHYLLCEFVVDKLISGSQRNSFTHQVSEVRCHLRRLWSFHGQESCWLWSASWYTTKNYAYHVIWSPVLLFGLPPVMEAKHNGEWAGRQHLLIVVVVQAVSCCQGKSVANLGKRLPWLKYKSELFAIYSSDT